MPIHITPFPEESLRITPFPRVWHHLDTRRHLLDSCVADRQLTQNDQKNGWLWKSNYLCALQALCDYWKVKKICLIDAPSGHVVHLYPPNGSILPQSPLVHNNISAAFDLIISLMVRIGAEMLCDFCQSKGSAESATTNSLAMSPISVSCKPSGLANEYGQGNGWGER